jgi:beta-lactamase class D
MVVQVKAGAELSELFSATAAATLGRLIYVSDRSRGIIEEDTEAEANQLVEYLKKIGYKNAEIVVRKKSFWNFLIGD